MNDIEPSSSYDKDGMQKQQSVEVKELTTLQVQATNWKRK